MQINKRPQKLPKILSTACFLGLFSLCISSCKKNETLGLADDTSTSVTVLDTFSVISSTVKLDSLPTAARQVLLVGNLDDPELGKSNVSTYFKLGTSGTISLPETAQFDSVRLSLKYSGYYFGDTTIAQTLTASELSEKIAYKEIPGYIDPEEQNVFTATSTFFNTSTFKYSTTPLGQISWKPRPASKDSLFIKFPNSFGKTLFDMVKANTTQIQSNDEFEDFFKGLTLRSGTTGNAVVGFSDTVYVLVHYNYINTSGLKQKAIISFPLYDETYQFNSYATNRSATKLAALSSSKTELPSSSTDYKTYIQAGSGLVTKLQFPGLSYLTADKTISINKAELIVESPIRTAKPYRLPSQLVMLIADKNNNPQNLYTDAYASSSNGILNMAEDIDETTYYRFTMTNYVNNYAKNYSNTSLFLSMPIASMLNSADRLVLGSQENSKATIKLKVTYTKHE